MARTAPVPNMVAIPGMNPGLFVLGGGGDGGGAGGGSGRGGSGKQGAGGKNGGNDASGGGKSAPGAGQGGCGTAGHPVDVVTGRAFTSPLLDISLPGPLPLRFVRSYSSLAVDRDVGLGFGWAHSFGWEIEVRRRRVRVWNDNGVPVDFESPAVGEALLGSWGWLLRNDGDGYTLDTGDDLRRVFREKNELDGTFKLTAVIDRNQNRIALEYHAGRLSRVVERPGLTGPTTVPIPPGMGQVIRADGTVVPATQAVLVPHPNGGYRTAYPIE